MCQSVDWFTCWGGVCPLFGCFQALFSGVLGGCNVGPCLVCAFVGACLWLLLVWVWLGCFGVVVCRDAWICLFCDIMFGIVL